MVLTDVHIIFSNKRSFELLAVDLINEIANANLINIYMCMIDEVIFLNNIIPWDLFPSYKNDMSDSENYFHNYFIKKTYVSIVYDGNTALYSALFFWFTIRGHGLKCCTSRIMVSPIKLSHYAKKINHQLINEMEADGRYASLFYNKLFEY